MTCLPTVARFRVFGLAMALFGSFHLAHAQVMFQPNDVLVADSAVSDSPKNYTSLPADVSPERWNLHGQATFVTQQKNNFNSPYVGANSLLNSSQGGGSNSYTFSATAFLGTQLWHGAEFYFNPEMFQGTPFNGQLVGLGGFQNGELQKGAFSNPVYYTARAYIRQTVNLGGESLYVASAANQLAGPTDQNRLVLSFGKFASLDFFDQNSYSHDTRTQFQNFALFSMGAYSYAADTKGYTFGAVAEWYQDNWVYRAARLALPTVPNTQALDFSLRQNYIDQIELTRQHSLHGNSGAVRLLYFHQHAYMGDYSAATSPSPATPDITSARKSGQTNWGYGINVEQALNNDVGVFGRWSWNPGNTETQTVDISRSLSGGVSFKGTRWAREDDSIGIGFAVNGLANSQIMYLQQGGIIPFIGDGKLNYKNEQILESYYSAKIYKSLFLSLDFQRIANPAYNASRGPVNFLGLRAHIEI